MHTVIILVIIFLFAFTAYATNNILGSPSRVYDLLVEAAAAHPVEGNAEGSYLTMRSKEGIIFFVINIVGNFGTVFLDNGKCLGYLNRPTANIVRLLQQSYRSFTSRCAAGLRYGRLVLACHSLAMCNYNGPLRSCS